MMDNLLQKLKAGTKNVRQITFPGTDEKVFLRILSCQDTLDAAVATDNLFKSKDVAINFSNINMYENEKTIQLLYRALMADESKTPLAKSITDFRESLSNEERNELIDEYNAFVEECSPSPYDMSADEFDALVQNVKKNASTTIGNISSSRTLKKLSLFLAETLATLQKDNGNTSIA
jgi:hypothetical protein